MRIASLLLLALGMSAFGVETTETPPPPRITGSFAARYGQTLDAKEPRGAWSFEPFLALPYDVIRRVEISAVIDRPMDVYANFQVPRLALVYWQKLESISEWKTAIQGSINGLNLDRWRPDGHQVRFSLAGEISREITSGVTLYLKAGPFAQWNHYAQSALGTSLPWIGLQERLRLLCEYKDFALDFRILIAQSRSTIWRNDYAMYEALTYRILPGVKLGVSHELESSVVDEITGRARGLDVFNSRISRISALMELEL